MNPWDLSRREDKLLNTRQEPLSKPSRIIHNPLGSSSTFPLPIPITSYSTSNASSSPSSSRSSMGSNRFEASEATTSCQRNQQVDDSGSQSETQDNGSGADRRARKKDQNRRAAYNYRRKKMEEKNRLREEEMRLVYSRVCLAGYVDELEESIMYTLNNETQKIFDKKGNAIRFLCPLCIQTCDNTLSLRDHLNEHHFRHF